MRIEIWKDSAIISVREVRTLNELFDWFITGRGEFKISKKTGHSVRIEQIKE